MARRLFNQVTLPSMYSKFWRCAHASGATCSPFSLLHKADLRDKVIYELVSPYAYGILDYITVVAFPTSTLFNPLRSPGDYLCICRCHPPCALTLTNRFLDERSCPFEFTRLPSFAASILSFYSLAARLSGPPLAVSTRSRDIVYHSLRTTPEMFRACRECFSYGQRCSACRLTRHQDDLTESSTLYPPYQRKPVSFFIQQVCSSG